MVSLKDILERYKSICESFVRKTKKGLKDNGDSVFELPENYIEIALMKIIESRGIDEVDIDWSEILLEKPIDKSKWVPTLVYIDNDDTLGVRWDKFLDYNTECGCIEVYEDSDTYESFNGQDEYVQTELYREVMDALGMEYVEPKMMYYQTLESFVGKVSRKRGSDLVPDLNYPDGVYILHETLGVKTVEGWNPKFNEGVIGILVVEDEHQIVIALEDSPKNLLWSKERKLVNQPIKYREDAESDFNGEEYCRNLNSPDFPAAYFCLNYKKGGRDWYLPSVGELWLIYRHREEVQDALSIVGGQKFVTTWDGDLPCYWSSTDKSAKNAWDLGFHIGVLTCGLDKVTHRHKVRPVSNFRKKNTLKESFTKKISSKKNSDLVPNIECPDGVYILHETLGVRGVDGWKPKDNDGVIGILLIEDDHKIVIALEDSPENLIWSKEYKLVNQPIVKEEDAEYNSFNGEEYCRNLNSPDFPAAYYCLNYNKGGRSWYLPSTGELWLIYQHIEEVQLALSIVEGKKFVTTWDDDGNVPCYWSSTEYEENFYAWALDLYNGYLAPWTDKVRDIFKVRPVSNFRKNTLKESFTKKIKSTQKNTLKESFTKKIKSTRKSDLISEPAFVLDNGVYILHETLGVKTVDGWNPKFNNGVVGVLVIEGEHQIVVALEDSPKIKHWSKEYKLVNQPIVYEEDAKSDFNGEEYCRNLNSPDFTAAYYCLNYNKGGRNWYLPSMGELWLIYRHREEVQDALSIVGGQKFVTDIDLEDVDTTPWYWSSTEYEENFYTWTLDFINGFLADWGNKVRSNCNVRPVSNFRKNTLKESFTKKIKSTQNNTLRESFTKKISSKKNTDLISKPAFVADGVYILHETLGVKDVEGWNTKDNDGVVGILLIEDEHQIVIALEDSPENLRWSKKEKLVNQPVKDREDAKSDFNGENYCKNLNSPDFPASYYCLNYKKGGRNWYLPSSGELWLIYRHLEEIQTALSIVEGWRLETDWYWTSSESTDYDAWGLTLNGGILYGNTKIYGKYNVRPVSNFRKKNTLKESFTKKISSKKNTDLISEPSFGLDDGVYILHETLGIKTVEEWNPKDNDGVIGVLIIDPRQDIVVAKNDSPSKLTWTKDEYFNKENSVKVNKLLNRDVAKTDLQGERYAIKLRERFGKHPASDYCLSLRDGGRKWYLPSAGQMFLIYDYINDVQNALIKVGGHPLRTEKLGYWTSTERTFVTSFEFNFGNGQLYNWSVKNTSELFTRPVSTYKYGSLGESFTKKISSKKNTDLISEPSFVLEDGIYILHETLGVKDVEGWNPKDNEGVVGILLIEDDHKIVVALKDSPENLLWSKEDEKLVNHPIQDNRKDANFDFNGEEYCRNLNSHDFPAAYYCLNYNKGGRDWYLPSMGELWLICRHLEEIQNVLSIVGGQKFVTTWNDDVPFYWSSTEYSAKLAWGLDIFHGYLPHPFWGDKVIGIRKVRPISKFQSSELKESFTKKISKKTKKDLQDDADESILPKNYIELALMSVLCSAKKEGIYFRKPKFHYKDDYGDVFELSEVFLQNDGQEIGGYAQRHYLEIEWNVYENGHMEEEPESDVYPFKDEDDEIKTEIYKKVFEHLGLDYVSPQKKWMEFNDNGFDYFDN